MKTLQLSGRDEELILKAIDAWIFQLEFDLGTTYYKDDKAIKSYNAEIREFTELRINIAPIKIKDG